MSDSVRPHRRQPTRLPHPWDSPGKNTGVGCHFLFQCMKVKSESEVAQSCPSLHHPMDCSLPGFSFHGIFQARVLEWGAIAFSKQTHHKITNWNCNQKYSSKQKPRSRQLHSWILPKIQRRSNWNKDCQRNINNLRYADDTTLMAESEEELKASWWKWKWRVKKLA